MKGMKKLLSILMVLTLVLSLGASAFATDVTIKDDHGTGSTYNAYQLFSATYNSDTGLYQYTLNDALFKAIYAGAEAVSAKFTEIADLDAANDEAKAKFGNEILEWLNDLSGSADYGNDGDLRTFADAVYDYISKNPVTPSATSVAGSSGQHFPDLNGYYLITETTTSDEGTAVTRVLLNTVGADGAVTVTTKEDVPSSDKKVKEKNDTTGDETDWQDAADYDIGDKVPFQLKATIPAGTTAGYGTYKLTFHDTEEAGLSFNSGSVKVYYQIKDETGDHNITTGYTVKAKGSANEPDDGCTFEIVFDDIKTAIDGFDAAKEYTIFVEYDSTLTDDAVISNSGNHNESHITYSNNPYSTGEGKTPTKKVVVFTFDIKADKVNGADEALPGAGFTLLKKVPADAATTAGKTADDIGTDYKKLIGKVKGDYVTYNSENYEVVHAQITGVTTFEFKGEDSGEYLLVETTVPTGYNRAEDIAITVKATYAATGDGTQEVTALEVTPPEANFTAELATGTISGKIVNLTGVELPSTGGIGTTIFYVAGAILVAGAAILLVTKKRVNGAEK